MSNESWELEGPEHALQAALVDIKKIAVGGCGSAKCIYQKQGQFAHECKCDKWITTVLSTLVMGVALAPITPKGRSHENV